MPQVISGRSFDHIFGNFGFGLLPWDKATFSPDMHQGCPHEDCILPWWSDHETTGLQEADLSVSILTPPLHDRNYPTDDSWIMGWIDLSNDRFGDFATDVWSRTENAIELQQGSQYQIQTEFPHEPPWINKARDGYAHSISRDRNPKFQFSFIGSLQMCLNPLTGKRRGRRTKLNHPTSWNNRKNIFFSAPCLAVHKQSKPHCQLSYIQYALQIFHKGGGDFFFLDALT